MNFIHPFFLFALAFLAVPIIVHLFNFRKYKKVFFTNIALLKELMSETQKASEWRKRLIMISRLLALFLIIFAFAQPYFNQNASLHSGKNIISIYIDNSFSMEAYGEEKSLLTIAKQKAKAILNENKERALYQIVSNNFAASQLQALTYQEASKVVDELNIVAERKNLNEIFQKQRRVVETVQADNMLYYWISDFQKNQLAPIEKNDSKIIAIPLKNNTAENIYIDSVWLDAPVFKVNQDVKLIFRTKRNGEATEKILVNFNLGNQLKGSKEIRFQKNESVDTFKFQILNNGWNDIKLTLADPNITFDNDYFLSFFVQPKPVITMIQSGQASKFVKYAFDVDRHFDVKPHDPSPISFSELDSSSLLVYNQLEGISPVQSKQILEMLKLKKNVAIFLHSQINMASYNALFEQLGIGAIESKETQSMTIQSINKEDKLMKDIFSTIDNQSELPKTSLYYKMSNFAKMPREVLLSLQNGYPFLIQYGRVGEGKIYLFASSIEEQYSNFVNTSLFAPILFKMGNASNLFMNNSYYIDSRTNIQLPIKESSEDAVFYMRGKETEMIPPQRKIGNVLSCSLGQQPLEAGFYSIEDKEGKNKYHIALNFNRKESVLHYATASELLENYSYLNITTKDSNDKVNGMDADSGIDWWKISIVLAILCLLFEVVLILFWDVLVQKFQLK
jgi:hypothetical protein